MIRLRSEARPKVERWLIVAFAFVILLQLELVWDRPLNWDEFFHLSETHAFDQGRLTEALQVFYARAFFWLPRLPFDLINQVRVARAVMLGCELITTGAIYAVANRFAGRIPAAFAALAYLTAGYVFQHGFSYRADPLAATFLMGSLWILLVSNLNWRAVFAASLLIGLATLTTIKIVFYAPAFAGVAWLRWTEAEDRQKIILRLAGFSAASAAFAMVLIGSTILTLPSAGTGSAAKTVSTSGAMMFAEGLFPRWPYLFGAILTAPVVTVLVLLNMIELPRVKLRRGERVALLTFMLPLISVVIYRNSFPYFYAFILPPVLVSTSVAVRELLLRFPPVALAIALCATAVASSTATPRDVLPRQRQVVGAAHEVFPTPVPYFDFAGMIADFPKANFFMSTWGLKKYRQGEENSFREILSRETVPLLVLDRDVLERNQMGQEPSAELLPEDAAILRESYIPHWGPLWVAGHHFDIHDRARVFAIYIPGQYTLEGSDTRIDGIAYSAGQTLSLDRGSHRFDRIGTGEINLRWGNHLLRPSQPFVGGPLFKDF